MKSNIQIKNSTHKIENKEQDTLHNIIDEQTKIVVQFFEDNNIPYHMEHRIAIRDDIPEEIVMYCMRCGKSLTMPYELYMDLLDEIDPFEELEYLTIDCISCNKGKMIPKKYPKSIKLF